MCEICNGGYSNCPVCGTDDDFDDQIEREYNDACDDADTFYNTKKDERNE